MNDFALKDLLLSADVTPEVGVEEKDLEVDLQSFNIPLPDDIWSQSSHELVFKFDSEVAAIQKGPDFLDSQEQQRSKASDHKSTDDEKDLLLFENLSPDSSLDGERSNSPKALLKSDPNLNFKGKRARNMRGLPLADNSQFALTSPSSSSKPDDHFYEKSRRMKQKKKKMLDFVSDSQEATEMKCSNCKSRSTPRWREGPCGPKTLCNACGMRYRKGLLFPEYRPASSPTFVPTLHSNSHRKVLRIRRKRSFALGTYAS